MSEPRGGERDPLARPGGPPARTIFFGSGSFGVPVLEALLDAPEVDLVAVVGVPDRPVGRRRTLAPSPVVARARALGLPVVQPPSLRVPEVVDELGALRPELGVLADYGRIVPRAILELTPKGILNLHPSLLPRHRGATPIAATILSGDREAGVTLMQMDERLDGGPVVAAESWPLDGDETAPDLEGKAAAAAARLLRANLAGWLEGTQPARPQDEARATMTRPLSRDDGRLDPTCPAARLERQVRAYQPWPGSYLETTEGRLIVWRAAVADLESADAGTAGAGPAGAIVADGDGLALRTPDGALRLLEVQLAGGRRLTGAELRRGHPERAAAGR